MDYIKKFGVFISCSKDKISPQGEQHFSLSSVYFACTFYFIKCVGKMYEESYEKEPENLRHVSPFPCYAEKDLSSYAWPPDSCIQAPPQGNWGIPLVWIPSQTNEYGVLSKSQSCGSENNLIRMTKFLGPLICETTKQ